MEIKPLKNEADYRAALAEIERLCEATTDTPEADRLEVLTTLVEVYEKTHYNRPWPSPIEAILNHMKSRGLSRRDLEPFIGSRARVSEVLNRKRPLSMEMIRNLHGGLGIPAEVLIQPYKLQGRGLIGEMGAGATALDQIKSLDPQAKRGDQLFKCGQKLFHIPLGEI